MMDLQKGQLILEQTDDVDQQDVLVEKINKSVLTPNMFGHQRSKRGNDTFVSSNPYIKFKKDNADLMANPASALRNQIKASHKRQPQSKANNNKLLQEVTPAKDSGQKGQMGGDNKSGALQHKSAELAVESGPESLHQQSVSGSVKAQPDADAKQ